MRHLKLADPRHLVRLVTEAGHSASSPGQGTRASPTRASVCSLAATASVADRLNRTRASPAFACRVAVPCAGED
eukprot:scaffold2278_cov124-Isochrysis_galbana.AAC.2